MNFAILKNVIVNQSTQDLHGIFFSQFVVRLLVKIRFTAITPSYNTSRCVIDGKSLGLNMHTLIGAWEANLEVRPEKDWEKLEGQAIVKKERL